MRDRTSTSYSATLTQHLQVSFHDLLLYDFTRRFRITLPRKRLEGRRLGKL